MNVSRSYHSITRQRRGGAAASAASAAFAAVAPSWMLHRCASFHSTALRATTIVCVRKNGMVCLMGDGMVSQGNTIVKGNAVKLRKITPKGSDPLQHTTLVGFAGSTADAFTLLERLEGKLDEYPGQLARSCVELAKGWRTDKYLRRLEASLIVADAETSLELTGNGDVLESNDGILGVGSGSPYAIAAARALMDNSELSAEDVARKAMNIAADMCIYTNHNFLIETLTSTKVVTKVEAAAEASPPSPPEDATETTNSSPAAETATETTTTTKVESEKKSKSKK